MEQYDSVKESLQLIKNNVTKVEKLKERDRKTANEKDRKVIMNDMEKIMAETNAHGVKVKKQLEAIKLSNDKYASERKDSAKVQIRTNMYQTMIRRFHAVMNEYNAASHDFKATLQDRTRRQLKIVDKNLSEEAVEQIVDSGNAHDVIKQALVKEELEDAVRDIQERHQDILKLERQIREVFELFRDLAALVELQQESLDIIETRISSAKNYTEQGEEQLKEAEKYQSSARKKQCILIAIVVAILVVILTPILLKTVGHS